MNKIQMKRNASIAKELIRITHACNERCKFCNIPSEKYPSPLHRSVDAIKADIIKLKNKHARVELSLSGGEPTIHPHFFEILEFLKENKIPTEIQTNALRFADFSFAKKVKEAEIKNLFVSFHSHIKEINDELTGISGSFDKAMAGMANAAKAGIEIVINTVLTKKQYKFFPEFAEFIVKEFPTVSQISVSVVQPHGRMQKNSQLLPNYNDISNYVDKGVMVFEKHGVKATNPYCGLPQCFGGWYKRLESTLEYSEGLRRRNGGSYDITVKDKAKVFHCEACFIADYCKGFWKEYLKIYPNSIVTPIAREMIEDKKMKRFLEDTQHSDKGFIQKKIFPMTLGLACNNRCSYCSLKRQFNGTFLPLSKIEKKLKSGFMKGALDLQVGGGEPTVHPQFIEIVAMAKCIGYQNIHLLTNGRMFVYDSFLKEAVRNGVNEVTFSIHGHTAAIHESITGVDTSFIQTYKGLKNALNISNLKVNAHVVLTEGNSKFLEKILQFLIKRGIYQIKLVKEMGEKDENENIEKELKVIRNVMEQFNNPRLMIGINNTPCATFLKKQL